jgi:hypothetical protein
MLSHIARQCVQAVTLPLSPTGPIQILLDLGPPSMAYVSYATGCLAVRDILQKGVCLKIRYPKIQKCIISPQLLQVSPFLDELK